MREEEKKFYCKLARTIQAWISVETGIYRIYQTVMAGANRHLISVTSHNIESYESKLSLVDSCLALFFSKDSDEWKRWRSILNKAKKLNNKRNKIVHQPIKTGKDDGKDKIEISPSFLNALPLTRGQTSYNGPAINPNFSPSLAQLNKDHIIDFKKLCQYEKGFEAFSIDLKLFSEEITGMINSALKK